MDTAIEVRIRCSSLWHESDRRFTVLGLLSTWGLHSLTVECDNGGGVDRDMSDVNRAIKKIGELPAVTIEFPRPPVVSSHVQCEIRARSLRDMIVGNPLVGLWTFVNVESGVEGFNVEVTEVAGGGGNDAGGATHGRDPHDTSPVSIGVKRDASVWERVLALIRSYVNASTEVTCAQKAFDELEKRVVFAEHITRFSG